MGIFGSVGHFISRAVKTAGHGAGSLVHVTAKATGSIGKAMSKVPVVGPALHGAYDISIGAPYQFAERVASGQRIDKAVVGQLRDYVRDVREVAPYAQTVISLVPAVGPGVSGVISGALVLSEGRPLSQAIVAGIRDGVPGGPAGRALFIMTEAAMSGKPLDEAAIQSLPIPDSAKKAASKAMPILKDAAQGRNISKKVANAAFSELTSKLPADLKKATVVGLAVGYGRKLQMVAKTQAKSPELLTNLARMGETRVSGRPELVVASKIIPKGKQGFNVGIGLLAHSKVSETTLRSTRAALRGDDRKGFDVALSAHVGRVTTKAQNPKNAAEAAKIAGYVVTRGMAGGPPTQKVAIAKILSKNPHTKSGSALAIHEVQTAKTSFWHKVKVFLGIEK